MQITNFTLNAKCLEEDTTFMLYCTETVCSLLSSHIKVQRIPKRMIQQLRHIFQYLTGESLSSDHTQSPSSSSSEIFNAWKVVLNHKRKLHYLYSMSERGLLLWQVQVLLFISSTVTYTLCPGTAGTADLVLLQGGRHSPKEWKWPLVVLGSKNLKEKERKTRTQTM